MRRLLASLFLAPALLLGCSQKLPNEFTYRQMMEKHPEMQEVIIPAERYQAMLAEREKILQQMGKTSDIEAFRIQPGTRLSVNVLGEDEFSGTFVVNTDGKFDYYGEIINVPAKGKTIDEMRLLLAEELKRYLRDPVVTINFDEALNTLAGGSTFAGEVAVVGEIKSPGVIGFRGNETVFDIIHRAGGLLPDGEWTDIAIIRRDEESGKGLIIVCSATEFYRALTPNFMAQDVKVRPRDIIFVPRNLTVYEHFERDLETFVRLINNVEKMDDFYQRIDNQYLGDKN